MKVQVLPSSIDENGQASQRQHLLSIIIDDTVAIDAGSLAMSCSERQRQTVRDIVLTHTHLDHIAGLPMYIDDLFATLRSPIRVHATAEMIDILERDVFNWSIYPRFSELMNDHGPVLEYRAFAAGDTIDAAHLRIKSVKVNHPVGANGFIVSSDGATVAITGDTSETDEFWRLCDEERDLRAIFVECAFPNELAELASVSEHLTPSRLKTEVAKLAHADCDIYIINMKPMYREAIIREIHAEAINRVKILEVGRAYEF